MERKNSRAEVYRKLSTQLQYQFALRASGQLNIQPGDRVLDIGCGTGNLVDFIAKKVGPSGKVVAFDPDADRIQVARQKFYGHQNVEFHVCTSVEFPWQQMGLFDHVITTSAMHFMSTDEKLKLLRSVFSVLKPGGCFAGNQPTKASPNMVIAVEALTNQSGSFLTKSFTIEGHLWLKDKLKEAGFEVLSCDASVVIGCLDSVEEFLEWMSASEVVKGADLMEAYQHYQGKIQWECSEEGKILHAPEHVLFLARKNQ